MEDWYNILYPFKIFITVHVVIHGHAHAQHATLNGAWSLLFVKVSLAVIFHKGDQFQIK